MNNIRVALVHDWLTGMRGGEKCLEVFCELFPEATLYTLIHTEGSVSPVIERMDIRTSFLQNMPGVLRNYRNFLPFFTSAVESFDMSGYDIVLSSSHCVAKGAKTLPGTLNICYCHTPVRYAWKFFDEYFSRENPVKKAIISAVIGSLKKWDVKSNKRIDHFIANSINVKNRIKEYYSREADVIYPPVDVDGHSAGGGDNGRYLIVSALEPYKRVDMAVEAFNKSGKDLTVVGAGSDLERLEAVSGPNIEFMGWADDNELSILYSTCRALIFPGEEDFGIVPLEAQAHGKPVIAYGAGGTLETIVPLEGDNPTGVFFREQTPDSLNRAVEEFEKNRERFNPDFIRENTKRFNTLRFKQEIKEYVESKYEGYKNKGQKAL